ncbi:prolyl endopeptidase-like [Sitodiplosis mosellana]|uniref:prolyl endopeptidase-like n=1 Tax=Sitodiplosis mosellana TaxID=263140 RepID=UPI002444ECFA|nr:prolyl endopeptidase-like [Sitodiplosis mosellana]
MRFTILLARCLAVVLTVKITTIGSKNVNHFEYPLARRNESVIDDYHGIKVADPYRWLEDPDSEETKQFIEAENKVAQSFIEGSGKWHKINKKLTTLWNYPKYSMPWRHGNYYYAYENSGLQNQHVLYKQTSLNDNKPTVFLDPNKFSKDGTISLQDRAFSEDGSLLAYSVSESGSDWNKIKFHDVESGKDFPDLLEKVKFSSMSWTHDNKGLFYNRYDQDGKTDGSETVVNENQKLYYHRVGESQDQDILVAEFPQHPGWTIAGGVSDDGKYLIIITSETERDNSVFYADLEENGPITGKIPLTPLITKMDADYSYVTNTGTKLVFHTNKDAPNYRVVVIDLKDSNEKNWITLIEEHPRDVLDGVQCVDKDKLIVEYINDVKSVFQVHSLETGKLIRKFPLEIGQLAGFSAQKKYSEMFYRLESFLSPGIIYRYDFATPDIEPTVFREMKLNLEGFDRKDFKVEQVFYPSRDGTKIPMFIVQKNTKSGGPKPCLLYGYGGFNISLLPSFSKMVLFFVSVFNGIYAVPNIRGGGEYGVKWHDGGRLFNKQNGFDDFQAAAEYLVEHKYTVHKQIAIQGGSNGGLLIGASITQRPELFGAAIAQVGVLDMLRFHKFTIGHAWISDYGNPDDKTHFENIYKFSPLHNVRSPNSTVSQYPSTLILTADHDDRVSPLHSLKFAAALQYAVRDNQFQKNPILLRVYSKAGHGGGKPTFKIIEEDTDILAFLYQTLQIDADI